MHNLYPDLDYTRFINYLSEFAQTIYGRRAIIAAKPIFSAKELNLNLDLTQKLFYLINRQDISISSVDDIDGIVERSKKAILSPDEIQSIIGFQSAIHNLHIDYDETAGCAKAFLDRLKPISELDSLPDMIKDGKIRSDATKSLSSLIQKRDTTKRVIHQKQAGIIRKLKISGIAESGIAIRQDRFCIVIKASKKKAVKGMVVDVSGTGASIFLDPAETIDLNNRLTILKAAEREEKLRILRILSEKIKLNSYKLMTLSKDLGTLDKIGAFFRYKKLYDCHLPELKPKVGFSLMKARHPLLISMKKHVVANDIKLTDKIGMVISGSNAGGKTVTLKTIGLSILAFYSSIPIPVKTGSWIGTYDSLFTIFGNKENMAESLSNFSSKLQMLKNIFKNATSDSLVLIDEITEGTDPEAGGNLAISIFKALTKKRISNICTTHLKRVSLWVETEADSIDIAGINFDMKTLMSTYEIKLGSIAESHTFDIAGRFLPDEIVREAVKQTSEKSSELADRLIEKISEYKHKQEQLDRIIISKNRELDSLKLEKDALLIEKKHLIDTKRKAIDQLIKDAQLQIKALKSIPDIHKKIAQLRQDTDKKHESKIEKEFRTGQTVKMSGTSILGKIVEIKKGKVKVDSAGKNIWINSSNVETVKENPKKKLKQVISCNDRSNSISCNIIGMHIEEAEEKLIRFLDDAILQNADTIIIVHGRGTGALKQLVRDTLEESGMISDMHSGKPQEGGDGITIAKLL